MHSHEIVSLTIRICFLCTLCFRIPFAADEPINQSIFNSIDSSVNVLITSIASKKTEKISDAPGVVSVITPDQLKRFGGITLSDILKRVPSFIGTTIYMTERSAIASRGDQILPSSSHILLLINGRPVREVIEGGIKSEIYESFPVSVIERIEIIRGPGSVLYGSQAVSAVINVITKSPENNTVTVSGAWGDVQNKYIMADLQYKIGDIGVVVAGRYADKGEWKTDWEAHGATDVYTNRITIPDYGPGTYAEMTYKNLRLMCSYNEWTNQTFVPDYQYLRDIDGSGVTDVTGQATWKKLFGDVGYTIKPFEWYSANMNITCTRSWFKTQEFPMTFRDAYEMVAELTNFIVSSENCDIIVGGAWGFMTGIEGDPVNTSILYNDGHRQNNLSGYVQIDYLWDWCKLIGGIQANKVWVFDSLSNVDNFDFDFNPRGGLILNPFENVNIKMLYSTAYRAPSIDELYLDYQVMCGKMIRRDDPNWGTWHEFNLAPEKVHTFDVGVNYQGGRTQFGINGFHSRMKNLIIQDRDTTRYEIPTWDNLGEVTIFGLECEGKMYLTNELLIEGSFLFQQSEDDNTSEDNVTPLPNFSIKGGLSYRSDGGLTISAFNTFQQALDNKYRSDLNTTTGYFNMMNVCCSYDFSRHLLSLPTKRLALVIEIDNLLDEEVWLPAWGLKPGSTIPYNKGRRIYCGFQVTL